MSKTMKYGVICLLAVVVLAGCEEVVKPPANVGPIAMAPGDNKYLDEEVIRDPKAPAAPSAVDIALEWANKYAEATARLQKMQEQYRAQQKELEKVRQEKGQLQAQLSRANTELAEANVMLREMRDELKEWKANVLGYRSEFLAAHQAQIEVLTRVLKVLGAEVASLPEEDQHPDVVKADNEGEQR